MTGLLSYQDALDRLMAHRPPLEHERAPIETAYGRRLAEPVIAAIPRPAAAVSAMDGYAVRLDDVRAEGRELRVIGEAPAGKPFAGALGAGEAVRIFTGAELPDGADHIVIQEQTRREGDMVVCEAGYKAPEFVRPRAMDFDAGDALLSEGVRLGPAELALAASGNVAEVAVWKRLRVGLLANGDELKPPGGALGPGDVVNSNPVALAALIAEWGGEAVDLGIAADSIAAIQQRVRAAEDIDIFLPIGGASVGAHDHMRPAFAGLGFEPVFEKVAVRPGKPTWFSTRETQRVLGLPGNPASAFVCAHLFLRPLITGAAIAGVKAKLAAPLAANGPRVHFMRAELAVSEAGVLTVAPAPDQDSSLIRPLVYSNALLFRDVQAAAGAAGDAVEVLPLAPFA